MKKLVLLAIVLAAAIAAPFALNQWQLLVERQHAYQCKLAREQAEQEAERAREQANFERSFTIALHQSFAEEALKRAIKAHDWQAEGHCLDAIFAARDGNDKLYQYKIGLVKQYLPKTLGGDYEDSTSGPPPAKETNQPNQPTNGKTSAF
jgi:hypothetical protein